MQSERLLYGREPNAVCDLNDRLAISEASVGRNVALRESAGSDAGLLLRLNEHFQVQARSLLISVSRESALSEERYSFHSWLLHRDLKFEHHSALCADKEMG